MTFDVCLKFFNLYYDFCAIGMFVALVLFVIVNICKDVYAKQKRQLRRCIDSILTNPDREFNKASLLPEEYARQWRAYTNGKADKPSAVMEFVVLRRKFSFVWLAVLSVLAEICFGVGVVLLPYNRPVQLYFVAYLLTCVLAVLLVKQVDGCRQTDARRLFGKFVALANKIVLLPQVEPSVSDTLRRISVLTKGQPDGKTLETLSELLRKCDKTRSVEEQRKLNVAVNGLLQSYANKLRFTT